MQNDFFKAVYCINLLRRPDRWNRFQEEIKKAQFCFAPPKQFTAVDGHHTGGNRRYCTGAWACLQSHLRIIELSVVHDESPYLVFEDDAILHPQFNKKVLCFLEHLPDDWGLAYLGGQHLHRDAQDINDYVAVPYNVNRTHCFAVRGTMRRRLYEMLVNDEYFAAKSGHIDHTLGRWMMTQPGGVYCPAKGEWFVGQDADPSSDISAKKNLERKTWSKTKW